MYSPTSTELLLDSRRSRAQTFVNVVVFADQVMGL
jgi:hypothetical protein